MTATSKNCHIKIDSRFDGRKVSYKTHSHQYLPCDVSDFTGFVVRMAGSEPFTMNIEGKDFRVEFISNGAQIAAVCPDMYDGCNSVYSAVGPTHAMALYYLIEQISEDELSKA